MNFKSKGLFISIIILILMMIICHTTNFIYPKNKNSNSFSNLELSIPNNTVPVEYNKIYYDYNKSDQSQCKLKKEAEIPCKIVSKCTVANSVNSANSSIPTSIPTTTKYQLSESEMAIIYRDAYFASGRELLMRTLNDINSQQNQESQGGKQFY
jgi:hypothetical protein